MHDDMNNVIKQFDIKLLVIKSLIFDGSYEKNFETRFNQ